MATLREMISQARADGYQDDNAEAKVCQDIVLKVLSESSLCRNATIKGGVVMRSMPWLLPGRSWMRNWTPGTTMNSILWSERKETRNGGRRAAPSASGFPANIGRNAYDG